MLRPRDFVLLLRELEPRPSGLLNCPAQYAEYRNIREESIFQSTCLFNPQRSPRLTMTGIPKVKSRKAGGA